jgi:histone deacetylase complex regulatory component SIN3
VDILSKKTEILLDEEIEEQEFIKKISCYYKKECYIYAIIPEYEKELFNELSTNFIAVKSIPLSRIFTWDTGQLGYIKDSQKQFIYEFYLRSTTMDYIVFSEVDVSEHLQAINKKDINIYKIFEMNRIPHITIGPDGQWLNIIEYN